MHPNRAADEPTITKDPLSLWQPLGVRWAKLVGTSTEYPAQAMVDEGASAAGTRSGCFSAPCPDMFEGDACAAQGRTRSPATSAEVVANSRCLFMVITVGDQGGR
jgi:hypothetical protein